MWQTQRTRRPKPHPRRCAHWKLWPRDANRRRKLGPASKRTAIRARPRSASPQNRRGTQSRIVPPQNRRRAQSLDSAEEQDRLPARRRRTKSQIQSGRDLGQTCAPRHLFKVDCSFTKSFVVPRGGLAQSKKINDLRVRGTPESSHTITRLSAAGVQP